MNIALIRFLSVDLTNALNEEYHSQYYCYYSKCHKEGVELRLVREGRVLEMPFLQGLAVNWFLLRNCFCGLVLVLDLRLGRISLVKLILDVCILICCYLICMFLHVEFDPWLAPRVHVAFRVEAIAVVIAGSVVAEVADSVVVTDGV